jgi:ArsR family transcriptional regulator, virulence genes transcriptional regulator
MFWLHCGFTRQSNAMQPTPISRLSAEAQLMREHESLIQHSKQAARWLKAIANQNRLQLLCLLMGAEKTVSELNQAVYLTQSALSQHLALLRRAKIVVTRRDAQFVYYRVAPGFPTDILKTLQAHICRR